MEDILKVEIDNIEVNTIEMNNGNINVRRKYVDVMLKTNVGKIELEVNACCADYVHPRNMAYITNIYSNHTLVGRDYTEETPIIQINFSYGLKDEEKIRKYKLQDRSGKEYVKNFTIYEINMEYYKKIWHNGDIEEIEKNKYYIMLDLEEKELIKISKKDKVVERYMEELVKVNSNPEFQAFMTYEEDQEKILNSRIKEGMKKGLEKGIQQGIKQGIEQGFEKGKKEGIQKGIKQGIEQGLQQGEYKKSIEVAKIMKNKNIDIQIIIDCTGIAEEDIKKL